MKIRNFMVFFSFLLLITVNVTAWAEKSYDIFDISVPGMVSSVGEKINNSGQMVVNYCPVVDLSWRSSILKDGGWTDIGTLGGDESIGFGMNASGVIVGHSYTGPKNPFSFEAKGFLYQNGGMTNLGTLGGKESFLFVSNESKAWCINDAGVVVGTTTIDTGEFIGFVYQDGAMSGISQIHNAFGINSHNQIVGDSVATSRPILYENGVITDLGVLPGFNSGAARDINDAGDIVGEMSRYDLSTNKFINRAFLYQNGELIDLGTIYGDSSEANDINLHGQIVGGCYQSLNYEYKAFFYENGEMFDLNSLIDQESGWILKSANAINDNGWIVGSGVFNGQRRAFLLKPVSTPEPVSSLLFMLGGGMIAGFRLKHRGKP